jgi:hypothetical protein
VLIRPPPPRLDQHSRTCPLATLAMVFTAPEPSGDRTKAPNYRLVEDAEQTYGNAGKTTRRRRISLLQGASATLFAMIVPYLLGIFATPLSCIGFVSHIVTLLMLTSSKDCASPLCTSRFTLTLMVSELISIHLFSKAGPLRSHSFLSTHFAWLCASPWE